MPKKTTRENLLARSLELYHLPFMELLYKAHQVHRSNHDPGRIQLCSLISIKTGGCSEDCSYCSQSAHYKTDVKRSALMSVDEVRAHVRDAKKNGAQRVCLGAAWKGPGSSADFERVLDIIKSVKAEGVEVCVTLGMLSAEQARRLKSAGLDIYNHNLDTSREYYSNVVNTHSYDDRLNTLRNIADAGIRACCGGIIGMGESLEDRCKMLVELASLDPQPESVPINMLVPVDGTPFGNLEQIVSLELVRTIAIARILMPKPRIRLSAGRDMLAKEAQILAFFAGANSIFLGEKLLTQANQSIENDKYLLSELGVV
ncbi:MAG: biotin synthase BioB [Bdellovibrionota bacterium]